MLRFSNTQQNIVIFLKFVISVINALHVKRNLKINCMFFISGVVMKNYKKFSTCTFLFPGEAQGGGGSNPYTSDMSNSCSLWYH